MINKLLLSAAIVLSGATTIEAAQKKSAKVEKQLAAQCDAGLRSITEDAARAHVYFLADDLLEGRRAGERGSRIAKQYIITDSTGWLETFPRRLVRTALRGLRCAEAEAWRTLLR